MRRPTDVAVIWVAEVFEEVWLVMGGDRFVEEEIVGFEDIEGARLVHKGVEVFGVSDLLGGVFLDLGELTHDQSPNP